MRVHYSNDPKASRKTGAVLCGRITVKTLGGGWKSGSPISTSDPEAVTCSKCNAKRGSR